jgi:AraC-like DNA-binding protein
MTLFSRTIHALQSKLYSRAHTTRRIISAKGFIDRHYAEPLDLEEIARQACFSKYHFIRLFQRHYGRTPYQYLIEVRVAKAKELIRGGMTVRGACFAVGYDSLTSFSARFRQMTGSPPSLVRLKSNSG